MSIKQTLEQERAKAAWERTPEKITKEYISLVRGASATILTCGLGQTIAFYLSKKTAAHTQLTDALASLVLKGADKKGYHLMEDISTNDSDRYRFLTRECLAYLMWLKRFAEARAKGE
jgi:CRISPR-associated protein Cmr5